MSFICPLCTKTRDSISDLQSHCMIHHRRDFVSCPWCTMPFSSQRMLGQYSAGCEKYDKNRPREGDIDAEYILDNCCAKCECRFPSYEAALKHYKEQHLNYRYVCVKCQQCFDVHENLERHYTVEHPRPCTSAEALSSRALPSTSAAMSPSLTNGNDSTTSANDQPNSTDSHAKQKKTFADLTISKQISYRRGFQKNRCNICCKQFPTVDDIVRHLESDHNTEVHPCRRCNRMFLLRSRRDNCKCTKRQISATNHGSPVSTNTDPDVPKVKIYRCHQCTSFSTTSNRQFMKHSSKCTRHCKPDIPSNGDTEISMEVGAEVVISAHLIKKEPNDYVRVDTATGSTQVVSEIVELSSDSEIENELRRSKVQSSTDGRGRGSGRSGRLEKILPSSDSELDANDDNICCVCNKIIAVGCTYRTCTKCIGNAHIRCSEDEQFWTCIDCDGHW